LWARRGRHLNLVGQPEVHLELAEDVEVLTPSTTPGEFIGIANSDSALLLFATDGSVARRVTLNPATDSIRGLAQLGDTLYAAAAGLLRIDLDSGEVHEDFAPGYFTERDPYFQRLAPAYRQTLIAAGLTYLYTDVHLEADQIRYILDGSVGEDHSPPGTLDAVATDSVADVILAQSRGQAFVSDIREWEEWGLMKVAAEPIYGSNGRVVALAGADVDIGVIRDKTRYALFAVLFVGVTLLLIAGSVSFRVSQSLMRPLRDIKDSALRIAAGYHDTQVGYTGSDEIGQLARTLNTLSTRLGAQARQSASYQNALNQGREQIALEHALGDLVARPWPEASGTGLEHSRTRSDSGICLGSGVALVWRLPADRIDTLTLSNQQLQTRQIAAAVLQQRDDDTSLDWLFETVPMLSAAALWRASTYTLYLRCREPLTLRWIGDAAHAGPLECVDRSHLALSPGERLEWHDGLIFQGPAATESAS
jgi:HAMP domain-containing protein